MAVFVVYILFSSCIFHVKYREIILFELSITLCAYFRACEQPALDLFVDVVSHHCLTDL
jgi:hypothetical protein